MSRLPETRADGARTDVPYPDCEVEDGAPSRSSKCAASGTLAEARVVDVAKSTTPSGDGVFRLSAIGGGIHRTDAHAQTARPAAFKKLEVMNDEITTAAAAAGLEP